MFKLNWKLAVFSLVFFLVFLKFGIWQISRADEKRLSMLVDEERRGRVGLALNQLPESQLVEGLPVILNGQFSEDKIFLLDNVVLNGKVGFEVLVPFVDQSGITALVNRGFVPMGDTRQDIPHIPPLKAGRQQISGHLYLTKLSGPKANFISNKQSPYIVQSADPIRFEPLLDTELLPHLVRLAATEDQALPRYWPLNVMSPERHYGYAFTWLLMAATVLIAFLLFTYQTNYPSNKLPIKQTGGTNAKH